jgi:hypothetical protein
VVAGREPTAPRESKLRGDRLGFHWSLCINKVVGIVYKNLGQNYIEVAKSLIKLEKRSAAQNLHVVFC